MLSICSVDCSVIFIGASAVEHLLTIRNHNKNNNNNNKSNVRTAYVQILIKTKKSNRIFLIDGQSLIKINTHGQLSNKKYNRNSYQMPLIESSKYIHTHSNRRFWLRVRWTWNQTHKQKPQTKSIT